MFKRSKIKMYNSGKETRLEIYNIITSFLDEENIFYIIEDYAKEKLNYTFCINCNIKVMYPIKSTCSKCIAYFDWTGDVDGVCIKCSDKLDIECDQCKKKNENCIQTYLSKCTKCGLKLCCNCRIVYNSMFIVCNYCGEIFCEECISSVEGDHICRICKSRP